MNDTFTTTNFPPGDTSTPNDTLFPPDHGDHSHNSSNDGGVSVSAINPADYFSWVAFQLTLMLIGGIGNAIALFSIVFNRKLRNPANALFALQATNDGILLLFCLPITLGGAIAIREGLHLPSWWCDVELFIRFIFENASPLGQAYIAINRFMVVFWPFNYRRVFHSEKVTIISWALGVWGYSAAFELTQLFRVIGFAERLPALNVCVWTLNDEFFETITNIIYLVLPFVVMLVCYSAIFIKLKLTRCPRMRASVGNRAEGSLMMFSTSLAYLVTYLPGTIYIATIQDDDNSTMHSVILLWSFSLINLNFALNPIFYALLNERIRMSMKFIIYMTLERLKLEGLARRLITITPEMIALNSFPACPRYRRLRERFRAQQIVRLAAAVNMNKKKSLPACILTGSERFNIADALHRAACVSTSSSSSSSDNRSLLDLIMAGSMYENDANWHDSVRTQVTHISSGLWSPAGSPTGATTRRRNSTQCTALPPNISIIDAVFDEEEEPQV